MADADDTARKSRSAPRAGTLALDLVGEGPAWTCLGDLAPRVAARRVALALVRSHGLPRRRCAATIVLADDAGVRVLNRQWRGFDKPTNVLSFPAPPPPDAAARYHLGDIVLAEETLAREAADLAITPGDHYRHLVLHGLLHLLGYDHETDAEAEEMEALETRILTSIGVADPYAGSVPLAPGRGRSAGSRRAEPGRGSRRRR